MIQRILLILLLTLAACRSVPPPSNNCGCEKYNQQINDNSKFYTYHNVSIFLPGVTYLYVSLTDVDIPNNIDSCCKTYYADNVKRQREIATSSGSLIGLGALLWYGIILF